MKIGLHMELAGGLFLGLLAAAAAVADNVYRSVDEDGQVIYSDRPVDGRWDETIELDIRYTNASNIAAKKKSDAEMAKAVGVREAHEAETAAEDAARQATVAEQRAANCATAKARSEKYNNHRKLYRQGPDGEREYLSSDELDAARVEATRAVDEWCS